MQYRKLGRTDLMVSCVGFGALPFAGLKQNEADEVLNAALDAGVNFIDTARGYRESEELIGNAVGNRRSEFFLATKSRARKESTATRGFLRNWRLLASFICLSPLPARGPA